MMSRLTLIALLFCSPLWASTYYILAGGTGSFSGADWSNANCKIPALAAGDVVYIGFVSGGNLADTTTPCAGEATHVFNTSGTSGSHITIKAATGADHGTGTGWVSTMGVDVNPKITWSNTFVPADGLKLPFWDFCGSFYDVSGKVGTTDTTGTYGFYFKSAGRMFGNIRQDPAQCGGGSTSNVSLSYIEIDGVEANSTNCTTSSCASPTAGSGGLYIGNTANTTDTVSALVLSHLFIHDIFGQINTAGSVTSMTLANSYLETNFSCGASPVACNQHSNGLDTSANVNTGIGLNNLDVHDSVFKNIQGTADIICLGGTCTGWTIYNNIFYYSSDFDTVCQHNVTSATCGVSKLIGDNVGNTLQNSVFYGNTISRIHLYNTGQGGADEAGLLISQTGSTGNTIENNLWWSCTAGDITSQTNVAHDYNTWLNTSNASTTTNTHEFQTGTAPGGAATLPFVAEYSNFALTSETVDAHLNDGVSLTSPYNLDFIGATRGADGTWERGAYEFNGSLVGFGVGPGVGIGTGVGAH